MNLEILHRPATGNAMRPPLALIHGSYCAAWVWAEHYLPFFAAHGYPCSAVSLRGHGRSPGKVEAASFADHLADISEVVASLRRPVLVGHSFGGLIAQHVVAAGRPVSGLVMLASTPPSGLGSCSLHMMARAPDVLFQLWLLQNFGAAAVSAPVMHRALFSPDTPQVIMEAILPLLQRESHGLVLELLAPPQLRPPPDGAVPALVVGGDADLFLPVAAFDESAARWRAEKHILEGAPHALMADSRYWRVSADIILEWLARLGPQSSDQRLTDDMASSDRMGG